jgi:polysaccharide deacetylase family protein (PEP-CTERM system associated)
MGTLVDILADLKVLGIFFWLAPIALEYPNLLRQLADAGHEIGCHGWFHEPIYTLSPERFKDETRRALNTIAELTGKRVEVYRAPYFSITERSLWALEVLAELGVAYDSSIFPARHWRYGIPSFEPRPRLIKTPAGPIWELPISVRQILGINIPASGGGYFRLYPYACTRSNFRAAERKGRAVVFYIHPWELDPDRPPLPEWKDRLTNHIGLRSTAARLRRLLREFSFGPLSLLSQNALANHGTG